MVKIMEIQTAVEKILKVSPSVRVVSVCDLNGKLVYSARSEGKHLGVKKTEFGITQSSCKGLEAKKEASKISWYMQIRCCRI